MIRAVQLCADSLGFIIPQEWKSEDRATEFRDYLLSVAQSIKIIRFNPNFHVFKTATGPVGTTSLIIFIYFKAPPNEVGKITEYYIDEMNERMVKEILSSEDQLMARATILSEDFQTFQGRSWKFHPIPVSNLRRKIMTLPNITHFENDPSIRVCGGFQPPGGEIERFSISQVEHDLLSPRERELAYPSCVIASQIKRYWIDRAGEYLIIANDVQTEQSLRTDYPGIFRILTGRIAHREGNWWMFRNIRNLPLIQTAALKLLSPRTAPINSFALDDRHSVIKGTDTFIYSDTIDIRYILGILNSRLGSYWYAHFGQDYHLGESMRYEPDKVNLYSIPIRIPQNEEQTTSIVELVGKLNRLYEMMNEIKKRFEEILQTATSIARLSTFGRYFDHSTEFDFSKVVFNAINTVRGKIMELRILSSRTRIEITGSYLREGDNTIVENQRLIELSFTDENICEFFTLALEEAIDIKPRNCEILLDMLKRLIKINVYHENYELNKRTILGMISNLKSSTRDLWIDVTGASFSRYQDIKHEIDIVESSLNALVYALYDLSPDEIQLVEQYWSLRS